MLRVKLAGKGGEAQELEFFKNEVTVGRLSGNDIVLAQGNVSKHHSRILLREGRSIIVDMRSTNGTYVNGSRVTGPQEIRPLDQVLIGDFVLKVEPIPTSAAPRLPELSSVTRVGRSPTWEPLEEEIETADIIGPEADLPTLADLRKQIHEQLVERLDLRRLELNGLDEEALRGRAEAEVRVVVESRAQAGELPQGVDPEILVVEVLDEALGLGPLETLLADDAVSEVMVNGPDQIYVERAGKLSLSEQTFSSDRAVLAAIERIVAPLGRRIDEASPWVDARLKDGSRVNAIIPPLALKGPCLTIRKFKRDVLRLEDLLAQQTLSEAAATFLKSAVLARRNIVISGGTGSGKTTTLNALGALIPPEERIISVEDAAELQLSQAHWIQLEARPANLEGRGEVTIRDLVKNCLRMRPDRILVGECRSGEALDMLQAMNTGHDGSLTTLHANSPRDALARLETMVLMAGVDLPSRAVREQVASAVHLIVQQARFPDGVRRVTQIAEVTGMEGEQLTLQDLFLFRQEGTDGEGRVLGRLRPTGLVPRFYDQLRDRGLSFESQLSLFRED